MLDRRPTRHFRRLGRLLAHALLIAGSVFALAALTSLSWNLFAPDVLGLGEIGMRQSLGLVLLGGITASALRIRRRRHRSFTEIDDGTHPR